MEKSKEITITDKIIKSVIAERKGEKVVSPKFIVETDKSMEFLPIPDELMTNKSSKEILKQAMKSFIDSRIKEGHDIKTIYFISEVSMLKMNIDEKQENIDKIYSEGLHSHPDREDKVIITVETKDNVKLIIFDVITDSTGQYSVMSETPEEMTFNGKDEGFVESGFLFLNKM